MQNASEACGTTLRTSVLLGCLFPSLPEDSADHLIFYITLVPLGHRRV